MRYAHYILFIFDHFHGPEFPLSALPFFVRLIIDEVQQFNCLRSKLQKKKPSLNLTTETGNTQSETESQYLEKKPLAL